MATVQTRYDYYLDRADECGRRAVTASHRETRVLFNMLAAQWRQLARAIAESLIDDNANWRLARHSAGERRDGVDRGDDEARRP